MDEERQQLRANLEKELCLSSTEMEPIWLKLEEMKLVDDQLGGRALLEDLMYEAKEMEEYKKIKGKRRARAGRPPQELKEYFEVPLTSLEEERAAALSEALALQADKHREVAGFREDALGGLLSPEQARTFVTSPAVRSFPRRRFKEWGIPPVGHKATVVRTDGDVEGFRWGPDFSFVSTGFRPWIDRFIEVYVEPPGITKNVLYGRNDIHVPEGLRVDDRYFFYENDEENEYVRELPESVIRYPWEDRVHEVKALPDSLLDELLGLSNALAGVYGWKQEDALWFMLTGKTPQVSSLEVSANLLTGYDRSPPVWTITLEVRPGVGVETVKKAYQEIMRQVKEGGDVSSGEIKEERKLAVFHFVTEQTKVHGKFPDWRILFERWNEKYPETHKWHYESASAFLSSKSPWDSFQRDFRQAKRAVMHPRHHFPKNKVATRLEEWQEEDLRRRRAAAEQDLNRMFDYLEGDTPDN